MVKRNELIEFVENMNPETSILQLTTKFLEVGKSTLVETGEYCVIELHAPKPKILSILSLHFSDELVGSLPHDSKVHEIISWTILPKEAR